MHLSIDDGSIGGMCSLNSSESLVFYSISAIASAIRVLSSHSCVGTWMLPWCIFLPLFRLLLSNANFSSRKFQLSFILTLLFLPAFCTLPLTGETRITLHQQVQWYTREVNLWHPWKVEYVLISPDERAAVWTCSCAFNSLVPHYHRATIDLKNACVIATTVHAQREWRTFEYQCLCGG